MLPAWLGVEEALDQAIKDRHAAVLQAMYREWPLFRSTLDLITMVLAEVDPPIATQYERYLVPEPHIGPINLLQVALL
jgi:phosphoenolpyruvate carboxylase